MAELDTSFYPKNPGQVAPLDLNNLATTGSNLLNLSGRAAIGDIYSSSTDPQGNVNTNKLMAQAGKAGPYAPQIAQSAQTLQSGALTIDKQKLDNTRLWWQTLDNQLYGHLNDPDLSADKVLDSINGLIGHEHGPGFTPQLAIETAKQLYDNNGKKLPPDQVRTLLGQFHSRVIDSLQNSELVPSGKINPDGTPQLMTRNGFIVTDAATPRGKATPQQGAPQQGAGAGGNTPPPSPTAGTPPAGPQVPTYTNRMPIGAEVPLQKSAEEWTALRSDVTNPQSGAPVRIFNLTKALDAVNKLGPGGTGNKTDYYNAVRSFANSLPLGLGSAVRKFGVVDPQSNAAYDEANKYLTAYAMQQAGSYGAGSDERLATTISANASTSINDLAAKDVIKTNIALDRARIAQASAFAKSGASPQQFSDFAMNWQKNIDPRAFMVDMLDKKSLTALESKLKGDELKKFNQSLQVAISTGIVKPDAIKKAFEQ